MISSTVGLSLTIIFSYFSLKASADNKNITLQVPHTMEFARGNSMTFPAGTTLYRNFSEDQGSQISSAAVVQPMPNYVDWLLPSGQNLLLDCSARRPTATIPYLRVRMVRFFPNGEYLGGCSTVDYAFFKNSTSSIKVLPLSDLSLNKKTQLEYAGLIADSYVVIKNQQILLKQRSEINFYPNGRVDFFTPKKNQSFVTPTTLGKLFFKQSKDNAYFRFFDDGHIQKGVLGQNLTIDNFDLPPGTGVSFAQEDDSVDKYLKVALLQKELVVATGDGYKLKTNTLMFHSNLQLSAAQVSQPFQFTNPSTGAILFVPSGSQVFFDQDRVIREIKLPLPASV